MVLRRFHAAYHLAGRGVVGVPWLPMSYLNGNVGRPGGMKHRGPRGGVSLHLVAIHGGVRNALCCWACVRMCYIGGGEGDGG